MRVKRALGAMLVASAPAAMILLVSAASPTAGLQAKQQDQSNSNGNLRHAGEAIFRYDTFGDEQLWTDVLHMPDAINTLSAEGALGAGLKVDVDALPSSVIDALRANAVDLKDPAVTLALLQLNAVVGVKGTFSTSGELTRVGVTCALCHSSVDDSLAPGIGHRLDGWANRSLNVGAVVALSPVLDQPTRDVFLSWGPGFYDPRHHYFDGTNIVPLNSPSIPVLIPSIFGLDGVGFETYTADGPISYWNSYVGVTQMGGHGSFSDPRIGVSVTQDPDLVTPRLAALLEYQLSLRAPKPPKGSFDRKAARRGEALFEGRAQCATCHSGSTLTDVRSGPIPGVPLLHSASEVGVDPAYAERTATGNYRTTPLRGLWQHPGYFHDGSAPDLPAVVDHYDQQFRLGLSDGEKADLVEYLKTL